MKIISTINHKGGVGKSTITTNLAGYFANNKKNNVLLGDFDIQQSSRNWLRLRPESAAKINPWDTENGTLPPPSKNISHILIDSPAGIREEALNTIVNMSDKIIVPLKPSAFDMMSTEKFFEEIIAMINKTNKKIDICIVGNMADTRAKSSENLSIFIKELGIQSPTTIRQAQLYVHMIENGLCLFDSKSTMFEKDLAQWQPLLQWVDQK